MSIDNAASTELSRYFTVEIDKIRMDYPCPFELFLYFERSQHLIHWKKIGFLPDTQWFDDQRKKGITRVWIARKDENLYQGYSARKPLERDQPTPSTSDPHSVLLEVFETEQLPSTVISLLKAIQEGPTRDDEKRAQQLLFENLRKLILPPLLNTFPEARSLLEFSDLSPEKSHGYRVALYSVAFALIQGRSQMSLLVDLALAGLLHDLGHAQIPLRITRVPVSQISSADRPEYEKHVEFTLKLLDQIAGPLPHRCKVFILQHHERLDGTGFPRHKAASDLDKNTQFLCFADTLDNLLSGQEDGKETSFKDALHRAISRYSDQTLPTLFEILNGWTKGGSLT